MPTHESRALGSCPSFGSQGHAAVNNHRPLAGLLEFTNTKQREALEAPAIPNIGIEQLHLLPALDDEGLLQGVLRIASMHFQVEAFEMTPSEFTSGEQPYVPLPVNPALIDRFNQIAEALEAGDRFQTVLYQRREYALFIYPKEA